MSESPELSEIVLDAPTRTDMQIVETVLGRPFRVGMYETVLKVKITRNDLTVLIHTVSVRDTARELKYTKARTRLMAFVRTADGWTYQGSFDVANADFVPETHLKYGEPRTPQSIRAKREHERMCARPGTSVQPMDSYERTQVTTDPMFAYWSK